MSEINDDGGIRFRPPWRAALDSSRAASQKATKGDEIAAE